MKPAATLSTWAHDLALAQQILRGDRSAFAALVRRDHHTLVRSAARLVGESRAEEVVQDGWIAVLENLGRYQGRSSLRTWISRIVANHAKRRFVRDRRWVLTGTLEEEGELGRETSRALAPYRSPTPESDLLGKEAYARVMRGLEELPKRQREVLVLRHLMGCSADEACRALEISEANQRVLLHRGRSSLRALLAA
jgi:RNA polymerase sigma-70 factor (ECF subfamily)